MRPLKSTAYSTVLILNSYKIGHLENIGSAIFLRHFLLDHFIAFKIEFTQLHFHPVGYYYFYHPFFYGEVSMKKNAGEVLTIKIFFFRFYPCYISISAKADIEKFHTTIITKDLITGYGTIDRKTDIIIFLNA